LWAKGFAKISDANFRIEDKSSLTEQLLEAVRRRAHDAGIPYQRFIRMALERAVQRPK